MSKRPVVKNWIVRVLCTVVKDVVVDDCTEEEARTKTFELANEENEIEMRDWEVISVMENQ